MASYLPLAFFSEAPPEDLVLQEDAVAGIALRRMVLSMGDPGAAAAADRWFILAFLEERSDPELRPIGEEVPLLLQGAARREMSIDVLVEPVEEQAFPEQGELRVALIIQPGGQGQLPRELANRALPLQGGPPYRVEIDLPDLRDPELEELLEGSMLGDLGLLAFALLYSESGEPPMSWRGEDRCLAFTGEPSLLYMRHLVPFLWIQGAELLPGYSLLAGSSFAPRPRLVDLQVSPCHEGDPGGPEGLELLGLEGEIRFRRSNARHNCCLDLLLRMELEEGRIDLIEEEGPGQPCNCICSSDVEGRIVELLAGDYRIRVLRDGDELLAEELTLHEGGGGFHPEILPPGTHFVIEYGPESRCPGQE